jgi:hypothetical protein
MIWGKSRPAWSSQDLRRAVCAALLALVCLIDTPTVQAQNVGHATGTAQAAIVSRFSLIKIDDMNFGAIVPTTTPGTVVLGLDSSRTTTGGVQAVGSDAHPARFGGYGYNNEQLLISINANSLVVTRVGGTETMNYDTFVVSSNPVTTISATPRRFRIASANGMFQFSVGATLRVRANQAPGQYRGNFSVTVNYQ